MNDYKNGVHCCIIVFMVDQRIQEFTYDFGCRFAHSFLSVKGEAPANVLRALHMDFEVRARAERNSTLDLGDCSARQEMFANVLRLLGVKNPSSVLCLRNSRERLAKVSANELTANAEFSRKCLGPNGVGHCVPFRLRLPCAIDVPLGYMTNVGTSSVYDERLRIIYISRLCVSNGNRKRLNDAFMTIDNPPCYVSKEEFRVVLAGPGAQRAERAPGLTKKATYEAQELP